MVMPYMPMLVKPRAWTGYTVTSPLVFFLLIGCTYKFVLGILFFPRCFVCFDDVRM